MCECLHLHILHSNNINPLVIFQVCGVSDRKYNYAELRDNSAAFAVRLQTRFRLKPNDVLAVCLPNIPEVRVYM